MTTRRPTPAEVTEDKDAMRWVDKLLGILLTISLAIGGWSLAKAVDHESRIAVTFERVENTASRYQEILNKLDRIDRRLEAYDANIIRFYEEYELPRRGTAPRN